MNDRRAAQLAKRRDFGLGILKRQMRARLGNPQPDRRGAFARERADPRGEGQSPASK